MSKARSQKQASKPVHFSFEDSALARCGARIKQTVQTTTSNSSVTCRQCRKYEWITLELLRKEAN
jgi:hypothetical protein